MDRREALKRVALIMGGTIIGTQAFLTGCEKSNESSRKEKLSFSKKDIDLLDEIGETIVPTTDTPGAKAVGIGEFMTMMLPLAYEERQQKVFREGLEKMKKGFKAEYDHSFLEGTPAERHAYVSSVEQEAQSYSESKKEQDPAHYFRIMKELTLLGYFTSEIGCTQARQYVQTPGRYEACIPYSKDGRAWI